MNIVTFTVDYVFTVDDDNLIELLQLYKNMRDLKIIKLDVKAQVVKPELEKSRQEENIYGDKKQQKGFELPE